MVSEELRGSTKCKLEEWCLSLSSTPLLPFSLELTPIKGSNHKDLPKKLVEATRGLHVANSSCVMKHWNAQGSLLESLLCLCSLLWWSHPALSFYSLLIYHDPQALISSSELHSYSAATSVLWVSPGLSGEESEYIGGGGSFALNTMNIFGQVAWLFGSWVFQFLKWESLNFVWLFTTLRTEACQASRTFTISWSLLKLMSTELVMLSNLIFTACKGKNEGVGNKQKPRTQRLHRWILSNI